MLFLYGGGGATVAHWVHAPETQFKSDDRTHNRTRNAWQGMFLPLVPLFYILEEYYDRKCNQNF